MLSSVKEEMSQRNDMTEKELEKELTEVKQGYIEWALKKHVHY